MLSDRIISDELLARIACGSSKMTKNKELFFKDDKSNIIRPNVALFIDKRNPAELSVNRISTLTNAQSHGLGHDHKKEFQPTSSYWGYAELKAELCFEQNCQVLKDYIGGTKPYHANIVYPVDLEFIEIQTIATYFAKVATFKASIHV